MTNKILYTKNHTHYRNKILYTKNEATYRNSSRLYLLVPGHVNNTGKTPSNVTVCQVSPVEGEDRKRVEEKLREIHGDIRIMYWDKPGKVYVRDEGFILGKGEDFEVRTLKTGII